MPLRFCAMQVSTKPAVQLESEDAQYRSGRMFGRKGPSRLARWVRQDVEQPPLLQGEIQDHLLEWQPSSDLRSERRTLQQQWAPAEDLDWDPGEPQGVGPPAAPPHCPCLRSTHLACAQPSTGTVHAHERSPPWAGLPGCRSSPTGGLMAALGTQGLLVAWGS